MADQPNLRHNETAEQAGFDERVLNIDRVARVVKGGRRFRFRALVTVGDRRGRVGMGVAKGSDVAGAITKAGERAQKNMITIPLFRHGTIPHEIYVKHGGARMMLKPAGPGTGVIAGGVIREILEVAGITDILSKSFGSANKLNLTYATLKALGQLRDLDQLPRGQARSQTETRTKPKSKTAVKAITTKEDK